MKTKLLKVLSVVLILYPVAATIWQTLPADITSLIPNYTQYVALITGAPSAVLGATGLAMTSSITSTKNSSFKIFDGLYQAYLLMQETTDTNSETVNTNTNVIKELQTQFTTIETKLDRNNKLQEANLRLKLSNPLIDEETKATYAKMLGE